MRDGDVIEVAEAFLALGDGQAFELDGDVDATDVELGLHFATGYTLDQVTATLDALDTLVTAGFLAAEARATGQPVGDLFDRLVSDVDPLEIVWSVESVEVGSLDIRAIIRRTGGWVSDNKGPTVWVLSGVGAFLPFLAPSLAVLGVVAWGLAGVVEGVDYVRQRRLRRALEGADVEIRAGTIPAPRDPPPDGPPRPTVHVYDVGVAGSESGLAAFVDAVRNVEGVERQSRLLTSDFYAGRVVRVWSVDPISDDALRAIAGRTGVVLGSVDEGPPAER
jgi:hypothetical protein